MRLQFEFMQSRWYRQLKMLFGFIFLFSASFVCITADKPVRHTPPVLLHIFGWIGIIFFGFCAIVYLYRELKFHGGSQATITDEGLYIMGECVPWSVITEIKTWKQFKDIQGLVVVTTNCEERIAAAPWWERWNMRLNYKQYGAVYYITNVMFEGSREAFAEACAPHIRSNAKKV